MQRAFFMGVAAVALRVPLAVNAAPTPSPTALAENTILRESAVWAGVGTEGLFSIVDTLGISPSGSYAEMTATLGNTTLENGGVFLYDEVDQASLQVKIIGGSGESSSFRYYTLVLLDPDSLSASNPQAGSNLHGIWANVRDGDICNATNANVMSFTEVAPTFGSHRAVLLLFVQEAGEIEDAGNVMRQRIGYPANYTAEQAFNRAQFVLTQLVLSSNDPLSLVNGVFYYMPCSTASAAANPYIGSNRISGVLSTCMPYCSGNCSTVLAAAEGNVSALVACPCDEVVTGIRFSTPAAPALTTAFGKSAQGLGVGPLGTIAAMDALNLFDDKEAVQQPPSQMNLTVLLDGRVVESGAVLNYSTTDFSTLQVFLEPYEGTNASIYADRRFTVGHLQVAAPQPGKVDLTLLMGWWAGTTVGSELNASNANVMTYSGGAPSFGSHRYMFMLYEELNWKNNTPSVIRSLGPQGDDDSILSTLPVDSDGLRTLVSSLQMVLVTSTFHYIACDDAVIQGPGIDGYPFPDSFGSTCAALCRNVLYSENGTIESCQNSTSLYGQPGCLCRDISFLGAPTLPPTPFPSTVPPTPTPLPTQIPVPAPTVLPTDEASLLALASGAVWAGQKSEGLFNAIDRLGLGPGGAKTDMLVTIGDAIFSNGDVFVPGSVDQSTLNVFVQPYGPRDDDDNSGLYTIMLLDVDYLNPGVANKGGSSSLGWGCYVHGLWANVKAASIANVYGVDLGAAPNVVSWTEPSPAYGSTRVMVLLLKQLTGAVPVASMRAAMGYPKAYTNATMPVNRAHFNAAAFADQFRLALVNAMFFYVPCTTVSAQALVFHDTSTLSLTECTPLCEGTCYELWPRDGNVSAVNVCPCGQSSSESQAAVSVVSKSAEAVREKSAVGRRAQWGGYGVPAVYSALNALSLSDDLWLKASASANNSNITAMNLTVSLDGQEVLNGAVLAWNASNQSTWQVALGSDVNLPSGQLYSLLLLDPQASNAGNGWEGAFLHGWWANLREGDVVSASDQSEERAVVSFTAMNPLFGSHRYATVLLAQSQGTLNINEAAQRLTTFSSDTTTSSAAAPMAGFALNQTAGVLASDFGLQVASAALFYMPCSDDVMAEVYPGFGPKGYTSSASSSSSGSGACTAFCSTTGNACASPTVLNGVLGCPCANVTFAVAPTSLPSPSPTLSPSIIPSPLPSIHPTPLPSTPPSMRPSPAPTPKPSLEPTTLPTSLPSLVPSPLPSSQPTYPPSPNPSVHPSLGPTEVPVIQPTSLPSLVPSPLPSSQPTYPPSPNPSVHPSLQPTEVPTLNPFPEPSSEPTLPPSPVPSAVPLFEPTPLPTSLPSKVPTGSPTIAPTRPSPAPSETAAPTPVPSLKPTPRPSLVPSLQPTRQPSPPPTKNDEVAIKVTLALTLSAEADATAANILPGVAVALGVDESNLVNFELLGWSNRRRLTDRSPPQQEATTTQLRATEESGRPLLPEMRHRRLGAAEVTFDVRESLSESGYSDAEAFQASVSSDLQTALNNGDLATDIANSCNCAVSNLAASTAIVVRTAAPSTAPPSPQPSVAPTRNGNKNSNGGDTNQTGTIAGAAAGGFCLLFLAGAGLYMYRKKTAEENLWLDSALKVKAESFRTSTWSNADLENPLSEKAAPEKGEPVMLGKKQRQDVDKVGRQKPGSSKKAGTEVELMSQHHQSFMQDFAADDDDNDGGSASKGKGKGKGKGDKRTPKGSRGEGSSTDKRGKKPLVPKPRTKKAPIDLSIGYNKDDDDDDALPNDTAAAKKKKKDGSSLDAMVSEVVGADNLESAIFDSENGELDDDVEDSDESVEGEGGLLAAISAAEGSDSKVGDAASEEEEPVSDDDESQDDIAARLYGKSLPSEDVIVQDLLEAVKQCDGAALRAAAACAMSLEKKKKSKKATAALKGLAKHGVEVVSSLNGACAALKAARRARDLDAIRETIHAMKLCGFALLAKGEIAKASKLAAKLVEKSLNEENTEKESGLVHLSI